MNFIDLAASELANTLSGVDFFICINADGATLHVVGDWSCGAADAVAAENLPDLVTALASSAVVHAAIAVASGHPTRPFVNMIETLDSSDETVQLSELESVLSTSLLSLSPCSCEDGCAGCWWTGEAAPFPLVLLSGGVHTTVWFDDTLPVVLRELDEASPCWEATLDLGYLDRLWGCGEGVFAGDGTLGVIHLGVVTSRHEAVDRAREAVVSGMGFCQGAVTTDREGRILSATLYGHERFSSDVALAALLRTADEFDASVVIEPAALALDGSGWQVSFGLNDGSVIPLGVAWELRDALCVALRPDALDTPDTSDWR